MARSVNKSSGKGKAVAAKAKANKSATTKKQTTTKGKGKKESVAVERFWSIDDVELGVLKDVKGIRKYNHDGLEEDDDGDDVISLGLGCEGGDGMSKENEVPLKGAALIVKSFLHNHSRIDLDQALNILDAYKQFITVKKEAKDWNGEKLSPCFLVSNMMELHSEMPEYEDDMKLLCGQVIHWEDEASYDEDEDAKAFCAELALREQATIDAIQQRFGKVDESVWNIISIGITRYEEFGFDFKDGEEDKIFVSFKDRRTVQLSTVIEEWAKDQGLETEDYDFLWEREKRLVNSNDTPITLGMNFDDKPIEAVNRKVVELIVRDTITGDEEILIQTKKRMLSSLMDNYADAVGVEKSELVFTIRGKRVFGHEHVREFNLSHYDVIDVTTASSFKCENCICCNPPKDAIFSVA